MVEAGFFLKIALKEQHCNSIGCSEAQPYGHMMAR